MIKGRSASFDLFWCMNMSNILNFMRNRTDIRNYALELVNRTYTNFLYEFDHAEVLRTTDEYGILTKHTCGYSEGVGKLFGVKHRELQVSVDDYHFTISVLGERQIVRFNFRHRMSSSNIAIRTYCNVIDGMPRYLREIIKPKYDYDRFQLAGVWICNGV